MKTLDWSPDSKRLATGGNEGILRVYDIVNPTKEPLEFVQSTSEVSNFIYVNFWSLKNFALIYCSLVIYGANVAYLNMIIKNSVCFHSQMQLA